MDVMKKIVKDRIVLVSILFLSLLILGIIFANVLSPYDPNKQDIMNKLAHPSSEHFFGTDMLGRDIFSRILYGGRVTLLLSFLIVFLILLIGLIFGGISGMFGGWIDASMMRFCDLMLSLPNEMMSLCIIGILGPSLLTIILALTIVRFPWYVKMIRTEVLNYKTKNYVVFSLSSGKSKGWVFKEHIFPPIIRAIIVYSTLDISAVIMSISALSFLGVGIQPPTAEWGRMLNESREIAIVEPWQMIPAGITLFLVIAMLNYIGDAVAEGINEANSE